MYGHISSENRANIVEKMKIGRVIRKLTFTFSFAISAFTCCHRAIFSTRVKNSANRMIYKVLDSRFRHTIFPNQSGNAQYAYVAYALYS